MAKHGKKGKSRKAGGHVNKATVRALKKSVHRTESLMKKIIRQSRKH
jgi:hypothetical protein